MSSTQRRALLVLDAQNVYTNPQSELYCKNSDKTISNINRLIDRFVKSHDLIVLVRHIHAVDGSDLGRMFDFAGPVSEFNFKAGSDEVEYDARLIRPRSAQQIVKQRYSALQRTSLAPDLTKAGVTHLVICGFMTNFCCESTARDAHDRDYYVTVVMDATGCPALPHMSQSDIRSAVGSSLEAGIAIIKTTNAFLKV